MSSFIVKTLGLNIPKLSLEGKIIFDEKSGEFYINRTITIGNTFTQVIQIAKFDFLNLYIPSKWFIDKRNLGNKHLIPEPKDRIIKPFYSKNKGGLVIPISKVVKSKGTSFDVNTILLKEVTDLDNEYPKLMEKVQERLSNSFNTPYDESRKVLKWLEHNELQKGEQFIFGKKFYVFEWNVYPRKYFILYQHNSFWNEFLFFIKLPNGYAFASDYNHKDQFEKDILFRGDDDTLKTIKAIHYAEFSCRNGYRLSKFLLKCAMEGFDIVCEQENRQLLFRILHQGITFATIRQEHEGEKTFLLINCVGFLWTAKLILRGKENNSEEFLNIIKNMRS